MEPALLESQHHPVRLHPHPSHLESWLSATRKIMADSPDLRRSFFQSRLWGYFGSILGLKKGRKLRVLAICASFSVSHGKSPSTFENYRSKSIYSGPSIAVLSYQKVTIIHIPLISMNSYPIICGWLFSPFTSPSSVKKSQKHLRQAFRGCLLGGNHGNNPEQWWFNGPL